MTVVRERVQLLVDALRSGEFQQATGRLARDGGYCCLGVACEVAIKNDLAVDRKAMSDSYINWVEYDGATMYLPHSVTEWYGFDYDNPDVAYNEGLHPAAELNDVFLEPFPVIADAFERTFLPALAEVE